MTIVIIPNHHFEEVYKELIDLRPTGETMESFMLRCGPSDREKFIADSIETAELILTAVKAVYERHGTPLEASVHSQNH